MDNGDTDQTAGVVRTLQIIVPSLASGLLIFAAVAFFVRQGGGNAGRNDMFLGPIMAALTVALVLARILVPRLMVRTGCQSIARGAQLPPAGRRAPQAPPGNEDEKLIAVFSVKTIAGSAILEGAGFCNLIAYLLEGHAYSLALGLVMMVAILAGFPTRRSLHGWLEQQQRRIREIRMS